MKREVRTDSELKAAAGHVCYELEMLVKAARVAAPSSPSTEIENIGLEAFLLHYRNLRAFLCPSLQSLHPSDIIASDYLLSSVVFDVGDTELLGRRRGEINTRLAHLSYGRSVGYEWPLQAMGMGILDGFCAFLSDSRLEGRRGFFPSSQTIDSWKWKLPFSGVDSPTTTSIPTATGTMFLSDEPGEGN